MRLEAAGGGLRRWAARAVRWFYLNPVLEVTFLGFGFYVGPVDFSRGYGISLHAPGLRLALEVNPREASSAFSLPAPSSILKLRVWLVLDGWGGARWSWRFPL